LALTHAHVEHRDALAPLVFFWAPALLFRKRFPLAAYGFFVFLLLLAPTSSILPIKDPVADRRLYLPMLGLLLIVVDFASRLKWQPKTLVIACVAIVAAAADATYQRAQIWSDPVALWEDTVRKSPGKARPHFQLAFAYHQRQQPALAVAEFERTAALMTPDFDLLLDWGLAYDDLHQPEKALEKLRQAAALAPTAHVYTQIGKVHATRGQWKEAMEAFDTAEKIDPQFPGTYAYKCLVHLATNDPAGAIPQANRALAIDPRYAPARDCLFKSQQALRGSH
jgi:tetratricopeptide (TPR) repeat protein